MADFEKKFYFNSLMASAHLSEAIEKNPVMRPLNFTKHRESFFPDAYTLRDFF